MTKCCNQHDRCYDTCGREKHDCDDEFQVCLETICRHVQVTLGLDQSVQGKLPVCFRTLPSGYDLVYSLVKRHTKQLLRLRRWRFGLSSDCVRSYRVRHYISCLRDWTPPWSRLMRQINYPCRFRASCWTGGLKASITLLRYSADL